MTRQRRPLPDWTVFRLPTRDLYCERCGGSVPLPFPIVVEDLVKLTRDFERQHAGCKPVQAEAPR